MGCQVLRRTLKVCGLTIFTWVVVATANRVRKTLYVFGAKILSWFFSGQSAQLNPDQKGSLKEGNKY